MPRKKPRVRDLADLARDGVADANAADFLLFHAEDLFHDGVGQEFDLRMRHRAFQHDLAGAELRRAVDQVHLRGEARQEHRLFHGGVAAADDADVLAGEEEAVAGGAARNAVADERLLTGQSEPARAGARGDDQRARVHHLVAEVQFDRRLGQVRADQVTHLHLGAELLGLLAHVFDQLRSLHAIGPAGKVLDQRGDGELAAGLVAFDHERLQVGAPV